MIRQEYVEICRGQHCAAALLAAFEFWTNGLLTNGKDPWMERTREEIQDGLVGLFGATKIRDGLKMIERLGFIEIDTSKGHSSNSYLLKIDHVHRALYPSEMTGSVEAVSVETDELRSKNGGLNPSKTAGCYKEEEKPSKETEECAPPQETIGDIHHWAEGVASKYRVIYKPTGKEREALRQGDSPEIRAAIEAICQGSQGHRNVTALITGLVPLNGRSRAAPAPRSAKLADENGGRGFQSPRYQREDPVARGRRALARFEAKIAAEQK